MAPSEHTGPEAIVPGAPDPITPDHAPDPPLNDAAGALTPDEAEGIPLVDALADEAEDTPPQPAPVNREAIQARIDALLLKAEAPDRSKINAQVAELRDQLERVDNG